MATSSEDSDSVSSYKSESSSDYSDTDESTTDSSTNSSQICSEPLDLVGKYFKNNGGLIVVYQIWSGVNSNVGLCFKMKDGSFCVMKINHTTNESEAFREINIHKKLQHSKKLLKTKMYFKWKSVYGQHIVQIFDVIGISTQEVMEYYKLPFNVVKSWFLQLSKPIAELHKIGYLHLDIRPENIALAKPCGKIQEIQHTILKSFTSEELKSYFNKMKSYKKKEKKSKENKKYILNWWNTRGKQLIENINFKNDIPDIDERTQVVLLDLGNAMKISKVEPDQDACGEHYRSPTMLVGGKFNELSDYWALGCTIVEWLSDDVFFEYMSVKDHLKEIIKYCDSSYDWEPWIKKYVFKLEEQEISEIKDILKAFFTFDPEERRKNLTVLSVLLNSENS